jgi:hypothetical protein
LAEPPVTGFAQECGQLTGRHYCALCLLRSLSHIHIRITSFSCGALVKNTANLIYKEKVYVKQFK